MTIRRETTNDRVIFEGIIEETSGPSHVAFYKRARRPDGKTRTIAFEVPVEDKKLLSRLSKLQAGEEINITIETDWGVRGIPSRVREFSRVAAATKTDQAA
jgi:hypothetical protein